jgi:hypothetical protein
MAVWFRGTDLEGGWRGWEKEVGFVEKLQYVTYWGKQGGRTASAPCLMSTRSSTSVMNPRATEENPFHNPGPCSWKTTSLLTDEQSHLKFASSGYLRTTDG